jgi:hypothetical protein
VMVCWCHEDAFVSLCAADTGRWQWIVCCFSNTGGSSTRVPLPVLYCAVLHK